MSCCVTLALETTKYYAITQQPGDEQNCGVGCESLALTPTPVPISTVNTNTIPIIFFISLPPMCTLTYNTLNITFIVFIHMLSKEYRYRFFKLELDICYVNVSMNVLYNFLLFGVSKIEYKDNLIISVKLLLISNMFL